MVTVCFTSQEYKEQGRGERSYERGGHVEEIPQPDQEPSRSN